MFGGRTAAAAVALMVAMGSLAGLAPGPSAAAAPASVTVADSN